MEEGRITYMADTFNHIMKDCGVNLYGTLYIDGVIRAHNIVSFWYTLSYILSQLGTHHITSTRSKGSVYFRFRFGDKDYDLRDRQQFLALRDAVTKTYNECIELRSQVQ